jgi:hypothetical protein
MFDKIEYKLLIENYMTKDEYRQLIEVYIDKYGISYANAKQYIIYLFHFAQPLHRGVTKQLSPDHKGPGYNRTVHHPTSLTNHPKPPD